MKAEGEDRMVGGGRKKTQGSAGGKGKQVYAEERRKREEERKKEIWKHGRRNEREESRVLVGLKSPTRETKTPEITVPAPNEPEQSAMFSRSPGRG